MFAVIQLQSNQQMYARILKKLSGSCSVTLIGEEDHGKCPYSWLRSRTSCNTNSKFQLMPHANTGRSKEAYDLKPNHIDFVI